MVCSVFTPDRPGVIDALIGYVDDRGQHHIKVFYSKEQGEAIVDGMRRWLRGRRSRNVKATIEGSTLPQRSKREVIDLTGTMVRTLNLCHLMQKAIAASQPVN